ncbi:MAG: hypothetical protein OXM55_01535 [Bdellovibrionales bacterium]|nr:hypothetical protein [Bdellovibrionales bacterium]
MLELDKLLWVIPGVIFIYTYNKKRPIDSINLSGWSYLFSLVIVASIIWLPIDILLSGKLNIFGEWKCLVISAISGFIAFLVALFFTSIGSTKILSWSYLLFLMIITTLIWLPFELLLDSKFNIFGKWQTIIIPFTSGLIAFLIALLFKKLSKIISFNVPDVFLTNCVQWEHEFVILSLQNDKIYIGILLKYPDNLRSKYESQVLSIIPVISGGRSQITKEVEWGTYYPVDDLGNCEIIIPRSKIVTFGKFNKNIFKHFTKKDFSNG